VSSPGQKDDLAAQVTAMEQFCLARGLAVDEWLTEIGGGMNLTRRTFVAVMDAIERGEIATLVIAHQDRLARFGFDYFEHGATNNDCDLVVANQQSLSPIRNLFTILWRWCTPFPAAWAGCADTTRHSRTSSATVAGEGLVKVTRIAYSRDLNVGKYGLLVEQVCRLGGVRSLVWDRYGSVTGVGWSDRRIRDAWMADGTATSCGVLANAGTETVRDAVADIRAHREAAKATVRRRGGRGLVPEAERKRLYTLLTRDRWTGDPLVRRWMRQRWRRGHNHTRNQIIIRSDKVRTVPLTEGADVWLSVPGLAPRTSVVPPATTVGPGRCG
jgi:hypothetical protein